MRSETEALLLHLALTQKDCPDHIRGGFCRKCRDTNGKRFLFPDDVRVECKQIHNLYSQEGSSSSIRSASCSEVGCLGWIPSTDPLVWIAVLFPFLRRGPTEWETYVAAILQSDFDAALPRAIKALEIGGILTSYPKGI